MINQETLDGLLFTHVKHGTLTPAEKKEELIPYVYDQGNMYHVYKPVFLGFTGSMNDIQMLLAPMLPGAPFGELSPAATRARTRVLEKLIERAVNFDRAGVEFSLICTEPRFEINAYAVSMRLHKPIQSEQYSFSAFVHLMFVII